MFLYSHFQIYLDFLRMKNRYDVLYILKKYIILPKNMICIRPHILLDTKYQVSI